MAVDELVVNTLGLKELPPFFVLFCGSFSLFLFTHQVLAPIICKRVLGNSWDTMRKRARNNWTIRIVSQVHVVLCIPLALRCLSSESLTSNKAFGWDGSAGVVTAVSSGYFIWDTLDAAFNFVDLGFVIHGFACSLIYLYSFRPFMAYFSSRCLLWEASTFFLNIHWFLDKTNRTGGTLQLINGIFLLSTFFFVRLIYGGWVSYQFFCTLFTVYDEIPIAFTVIYGGGNIVLQGLNYLWFYKMVSALRKRFKKPATEAGKIKAS